MPGTLEASFAVKPAVGAFPIDPSDTTDIPATRGIWVGTLGDIRVRMLDGSDVTFFNATAGIIHPMQVIRVFSTGTNALDIRGLV